MRFEALSGSRVRRARARRSMSGRKGGGCGMGIRSWSAVVVAIAVVALPSAASAAPGNPLPGDVAVYLRVEGASQTLFEGPVWTSGEGQTITTASGGTHQCDGTNDGSNPQPGATPTVALADALATVGTTFDGTWYAAFDDFSITRIGPDSQTATEFWGILDNWQFTPTSGCQFEVSPGDDVLWAYNVFSLNYFLRLTASTTTGSTTTTVGPGQTITVQPGQAITVHVTDGMTDVVIPGAQVAPVSTNPANDYETVDTSDPSTVTTDASGDATLSWSTPGWKRVKAVRSDSVRSNRLDICVTPCGPPPADTLISGNVTSAIATAVDDAATNSGWAGTESTGAQAYDTATMSTTGSAVTPAGTVTYSYYTNGSCTAPAQSTQTVTLNPDGSVPDSSTTTALDPGSYSYQASYSGDAIYPASTGACEPFTVAKGSQTITFTSILPNPATFGGSYTPAATGGASGNPVVFSIDPSSGAGVCSISNSGTVSFTGVGTCVIDANQVGNSDYAAAVQAQQSVPVAKDPTTTSLAASVNSALATQAVTFTATVTPAPDGGTVAFDDGASAIAGCGAVNLAGGSATCQTSSLPVGFDQVAAVYSGDANYQGSSSSPALTETVIADTPQNLAALTLQYVETSPKFQALSPAEQKVIVALANQAISALGKITPHLTPAQLAALVAAYKQGVAALQAQGWLTSAQASTLDGLAGNLQT
jgi:Bacterial Ig-like domain (group 3)